MISPPWAATKERKWRVRSWRRLDIRSSSACDGAGSGMPTGNCGVRTGRGPPGRSLTREKGAQGGAAEAAPTMPEHASPHRLEYCESSSRSKAQPCSLSNGSRRARPSSAKAADRGAEAPANKSTNSLQDGSGVEEGDGAERQACSVCDGQTAGPREGWLDVDEGRCVGKACTGECRGTEATGGTEGAGGM